MSSVEMTERVKIVIIGAGIAGISAANRLISNGFNDVTILEGEGRVGGRIRTDSYGTGIIEMGAQWIHGEDNNPVYDLAAGHDLVDQTKDFEEETCTAFTDNIVSLADDDEHLFYTSSGKIISPSIVNETFSVLDYSFKDATKFARNRLPPNNVDETVGTFIQNAFRNYLERSDDTDEVKKMKESLFNWRLLKETIENGCTSIYDMSLYAWGEYIECPGNEEVVLRRGYKPVLDVITDKIPCGLFHLNTHVQQIVWKSNDATTSDVTTNSNLRNSCSMSVPRVKVITLKNEVYEADHVIVTCSLGYLKRHKNDMFLPQLPDQKIAAIDRLGFGTVNKIYLEFERPFSDKFCANIQLAWLPDDSFIPSKYQNDNLFDTKWYKGIHGFELVDNQPCLLCGWIAGREAEMMESLPDDLVVDVCQDLLQTFTGDRDIPRPIKITRSKWFSNVYSLGSYSYRHTGSTASDSCELAKPLPSADEPSLMFAGEATHDAYFSTTHGAYLSGQREAARIINTYRQVPLSTNLAN